MYISFNTEKVFDYHWSGRFIAPNDNWIHMTRELTDFELVVVTEGTLNIECDGMKFSASEGEYLLMPPSKLQRGTEQGYCSFYWVHFNADDYTLIDEKDMNQAYIDETLSLNGNDKEKTIRLKQQAGCFSKERVIILLKELQDADKRYRNSNLNNYLTGALLTELSLQNREALKIRTVRSKEQLNSDIKTYLSWHISEALRIDEVASYFEYNEKYLTTLFKKMNGIPLKQYILQEKMEYAKSVLTESNTTVSEVAYSIGFSDVHNFSNAFKAVVGMAPGVYRKQFDKHSLFDK